MLPPVLESGTKTVFYRDSEFKVHPDVYEPAEDTFLLADNLDARPGELVLELGTGCGILAILAAKAGSKVVATDINPAALRCARENAATNGVSDQIDFRFGHLFEPVAGERFDLAIFNPPYLPIGHGEAIGRPLDRAWEAGPYGREAIDEFLLELPKHLALKGRALLLQSSLADVPKTLEALKRMGFRTTAVRNKLWFEELFLIRCLLPK